MHTECLDSLKKANVTTTTNHHVRLQIGDYVFANFDARWSSVPAPGTAVTA